MNYSNFKQIQLSYDSDIKPFNCKEKDLNDFLFEDAKRYQKELMAITYVVEDISANCTVAFYSLLADKISFNPEEKKIWNKLNRSIPNNKRRKSYPAIKIGRFAVDKRYAHLGIGSMLIQNIKYAFTKSKRVGCRFLTVDALQSAVPFYVKCGFDFFTRRDENDETRLMFFDLKNFTTE